MAGTQGRILTVGDDPAVQASLSALLTAAGHQPVAAATGTEALTAIAAGGIDFVLMPVQLADLPATEVCRRIRHELREWTLPIVIMAPRSARAERVALSETGANAFVEAPVYREELLATVSTLMRARMHFRTADHERLQAEREAEHWRLLADIAIMVARCRTFDELVDSLANVLRVELETQDLAYFEKVDGMWNVRAACGGAAWLAVLGLLETLPSPLRATQGRIGSEDILVLPIRANGKLQGALCVTSKSLERKADHMLREINNHLSNVFANVESWRTDPPIDMRSAATISLRKIARPN